jgi:hypothetical protein
VISDIVSGDASSGTETDNWGENIPPFLRCSAVHIINSGFQCLLVYVMENVCLKKKPIQRKAQLGNKGGKEQFMAKKR